MFQNIKYDIISKNINGVACYFIDKPHFKEKMALIGFKFGSMDTIFDSNNKEVSLPSGIGIAHFLEHKLFEQKDFDVFQKFSKFGGSVNAFTNTTTTAYHFNCIDNFYDNLDTLLSFVSNPYFSEDSIKKEKGIIEQEIKMYDDDPSWCAYFNLLKALYKNSTVKEDIAGTVDGIQNVNKDLLYMCYDTFYSKDNAFLICVGDIDVDHASNVIANSLQLPNHNPIKRTYISDRSINTPFISQKLDVSQPIFNLGFRDNNFNTDVITKLIYKKMNLDLLIGESSDLFEQLYKDSIIDNSFYYDYNLFERIDIFNKYPDYGFSLLCGTSQNPKLFVEKLLNYIQVIKNRGFNQDDFHRIKNKYKGIFARTFNSSINICLFETDFISRGFTSNVFLDTFEKVSLDDVFNIFNSQFDTDFMSLSVIEA